MSLRRFRLRDDCAKLSSYLLITIYGIATLIEPQLSLTRTPVEFRIMFSIQIVLSGVILLSWVFVRHDLLYIVGSYVWAITLFVLGVLVLVFHNSATSLILVSVSLLIFSGVKQRSLDRAEMRAAVRNLGRREP